MRQCLLALFISALIHLCSSAIVHPDISDISAQDLSVINASPLGNKDRDGRNLALFVVSITRSYRATSITTVPHTSIMKCYSPATVPICSRKKRDAWVEPDIFRNEMLPVLVNKIPKILEPISINQEIPLELDGSVELLEQHEQFVYDYLPNVRQERFFRPQSYVSSTTMTTTSTYTTTLYGSTSETIVYVRCRAPYDPVDPAC